MNKKTVLNRGDIVVIDPQIACSGKHPFNLQVTEVKERFGIQPRSGRLINNLVKGFNLETGEEEWYNFDMITEIKSRGKQKLGTLPENIFWGFKPRNPITQTSATRTGFLLDLIRVRLGRLPFQITTPLHEERCYKLFSTQGISIRGYHGWKITVRKKTFDGWIRRNHTRLVHTKEELHEMGTEELRREDAMMCADLDAWLNEIEEYVTTSIEQQPFDEAEFSGFPLL